MSPFDEVGHRHVTQADWKDFKEDLSPYLVTEVVDRTEISIPEWYLPLARGAAIASDHLLRRAGYRPGSDGPRGWKCIKTGDFCRELFTEWASLDVRRCGDRELFTVERFGRWHPYKNWHQVLIHTFGSTPVFTRNYQSAMQLAEYCHMKGPPLGLNWITAVPADKDEAVEFARRRRIQEYCNS